MNTPITSRIKRSPLLKYSPLKNDKDPKATTGGTEKGEDREIEVTEQREKPQVGAFKRACGSKTDGSTGTDPQTGKKFKCAQAEKGNEPEETETVTTKKTVPGEDLDYDTTLYTKKKDKVVFDPIEVRRQERAGTVINRKVNKYERQMGKYGTFDMEGNFTPDENLSQRDMRKLRQASANLKGAKSASSNVQAGRESGQNIGDRYYGGQRQMDKGERTDAQQLAEAKRQAQKENRQKIAEEQNITTGNSGQASKAITPGQQIQNMAAEFDTSKYALDFNAGDYSSFLKMKSSPAKKSLKGNQYKLPQHLQEAIKAAPGKLRTPMKKGYFKNK